ncbi:MAG: SGNH/GDSL hydrolase family protein [Bryobacterales bacterium]|nr:SGNH/GDSL hydrolase family protein [Bryobacterales bacterium]
MFKLFLALLLTAASLFGQAGELTWLTVPDARLEIDGLPWQSENGADLIRFPRRLEKDLRKPVWELAQSPSGGRIRFSTDSTKLVIRLEYPSAPGMRNMHAFGQTGVDLYFDGIYRGTAIATPDSKPGNPVEHVYFENQPGRVRELTLYLPLYKPVKVLGIGIDKGAGIGKAASFALPKPVVFYGTSITQGGCASRSGMSYQAILGRELNIDFVNLGFSGNGKGEPEVARAVAEIDASAFVLDFSQNNETLESLIAVYDPFIATLRAKHPLTPIIAITPIANAREQFVPGEKLEKMRDHIRQVVSRRIGAGDANLQIIEGTDLLGPGRLDGLVDGTHPNDLGFEWMADGIAVRLAKILGLRVQ